VIRARCGGPLLQVRGAPLIQEISTQSLHEAEIIMPNSHVNMQMTENTPSMTRYTPMNKVCVVSRLNGLLLNPTGWDEGRCGAEKELKWTP
jgi:hypothetical protein